ncbi:MAG TPA: condensation domain-containing protein, partial [Bryobacteraceae bacterium]|nr:condensation domain-containing protein [Bryobacteraceae bacterium]
KLSTIEHIIDGNIVCFVRLEGSFSLDQLRSALSRVQRRHPALRALIREETDGLYYEADSAPEIPLRIVPRVTEDDYRRECHAELTTDFVFDKPQLRAVWVRSELESDLLLTTSHRICDGMSIMTIVREVSRCLHNDEELIPYEPVTVQDIIGDYRPSRPWRRKLVVRLVNGLLRLVPGSRREPESLEHYLEWSAGHALSNAVTQRCKAEGISVHALLVVALDRALSAVFGKKNLPEWIDNQMDPRRMRFGGLKSDMLFLAGGSFKVRAGQAPDLEFWARTRAINQEMRNLIEQEILDAPGRFHFFEMLRPPTGEQLQSIIGMNYAFSRNNRLTHFPLSNLGNVVVIDSDAPFRLKDLRLYVHSFKTRAVGLVTYTVNGDMRFYCLSHEKCMSGSQVAALKREFMALLQQHVLQPDDRAGEVPRMVGASAGSSNHN